MKQQGFVLIMVLWAVSILTIVALGFGQRAILDTRASAYALDYAQALLMARGAAERGVLEVRNKIVMNLMEPDPPAGTHLGQPWAQVRNLLEEKDLFTEVQGLDRDRCVYVIEDAERYININAADRALLENIKALNQNTVKKIWSRRTEETYPGEGVSAFQAPEELRYFQGVSDEDWFGGKRTVGLKNLLHVAGSGRINVNTASREVMLCVPGLKGGLIDSIIAYRNGPDGVPGTKDDRGFKHIQDLQQKLGVPAEGNEAIGQFCSFDSSSFIITGTATRQGGKIRASCTVTVRVDGNNATVISWKEDVIGA